MENDDRTLKELATPDVVYSPWCIQYPQLEPAQTYELKSDLIHLLPKFHGLVGKDPYKHLKEFHVVCSTMRPQGIPEYYIKMKAFPFSLDGTTKDWLYLQSVLFNTWGDIKCLFLDKFFSASRIATIRKEICGIRQHFGETLHEYWERFNKLCATCPHHHISLTMMDRSIIDAASGGALMDKMPAAARHLISNIKAPDLQYGKQYTTVWDQRSQPTPNVDNLRLENQLTELTSLVRQLTVGQHQPSITARVCGICTSAEHPTNMCPTLHENESDYPESVGAIVVWKETNSAKAESRAICSSAIWTFPECTSRSNRLLTTNSAILGTAVPAVTTTENANSRQLTVSGGPDEAISN
ncbi:hypothetical protein CR513_14929, partial [Mucuna pruriens]